MKNSIKIILAIIFYMNFNSVYAEQIQSVQINEEQTSTETVTEEDDMFAPIELDLTDYTKMNKKNKKFKLSVSKETKPTYIKNNGQVWSEDKIFLQNYYSDETNLRVLPSYGSLGSYITRDLDENTSVTIGQDSLTELNGDKINFALDGYSYYSSGVRLDGKTENTNYSIGAFTETDTLNQQLAAVIGTKPKSILNSKGKFYVGGGIYSNLKSDVNFNTAGLFAQYKNDKLSVGAQIANSSYTKSEYSGYNKAHLLTTYKVNEHLTLKNKIVQNFEVNELQGEVGLVLNPLKETDRLELELTAANYQSQNVITRQRLKFITSFKF